MKRNPVKIAAALLWRTADEIMYVRVDNLQRQRGGKRSRAAIGIAIYPNLQAFMAVANPHLRLSCPDIDMAKQHKLPLTVANEVSCCRATKRFATTKIRQRLQDAGFA